MVIGLTTEQFKGTMTSKMIDVTSTADALLDIWPYVSQLVKQNIVLPYVFENQLVELVYRDEHNTFEHVLLPTEDRNKFVVLVINLNNKTILGHFPLEFKKEYGLV